MKQGRGIVVEVTPHDHVIIMTPQGEFLRIPFKKPVCVGQEIHYTIKRPPVLWKWSVAAVILLALVGSAGQINTIPGGATPAYFITLDINPSIELAINAEQRVVYADGLNPEGDVLVEKLNLIGRTFKQAIALIENQAELDGYLKPGQNEIVITIAQDGINRLEKVALDDSQYLNNGSEAAIEAAVKEILAEAYNVQMWKVPTDTREKARASGMTPAKYIALYVNSQRNDNAGSSNNQSTTPVKVTIERNGDQHSFEIEVTRPVFTPVKLTRTKE